MLTFLKSLPPSVALTLILSFIVQPYGQYGTYLSIHQAQIAYFSFFWSWPIFFLALALAWGFFLLIA